MSYGIAGLGKQPLQWGLELPCMHCVKRIRSIGCAEFKHKKSCHMVFKEELLDYEKLLAGFATPEPLYILPRQALHSRMLYPNVLYPKRKRRSSSERRPKASESRPTVPSKTACFFCCSFKILSSMVPPITNRVTWIGLYCPSLWIRSWACMAKGFTKRIDPLSNLLAATSPCLYRDRLTVFSNWAAHFFLRKGYLQEVIPTPEEQARGGKLSRSRRMRPKPQRNVAADFWPI